MTLGGPGTKISEPLLSTPGKITMSEAGRISKKANLTERLHRGTQASVKMGRRQMQHRIGDIYSQRPGETPDGQDFDELAKSPSRLGKRPFFASHLPMTMTPEPKSPIYQAYSSTREYPTKGNEPESSLYGLSSPLSARRLNKEG